MGSGKRPALWAVAAREGRSSLPGKLTGEVALRIVVREEILKEGVENESLAFTATEADQIADTKPVMKTEPLSRK